jgi:ubiquinone/menaquinone biosynthesis C-methylase UbiE
VCNYFLNLFPNRNTLLNEIYRVLKPGGYFIISDLFANKSLPPYLDHSIHSKYFLQNKITTHSDKHSSLLENDYFELIKKVGFTDIIQVDNSEIDIENGEIYLYVEPNDLKTISSDNILFYKKVLRISK